jgi:predicted dehydrogenase
MAPLRFVLVGTGGMGAYWCAAVFPYLRSVGKGEVVAAVDVVPEHLENARSQLGLAEERCYTELARALDQNEADAITIVVPPAHHEAVVDVAIEHGLHILSEKPIADSMAASCRIVKKAHAAGRKMCVTMSHRFDQDKLSLEERVWSGEYGALNYVVHRFTHNAQKFGDWGAAFRHTMADPLLIEGTVHHFDIHRALTRSNPAMIYARTWNPPWGEYGGDSTAHVLIEMLNGTHVLYEGAKANASTMNGWGNDYIRAECEFGSLELDARILRVIRSSAVDYPEV